MNNLMETLQNQADQCSLPIKITKLEKVEDTFDSHIEIHFHHMAVDPALDPDLSYPDQKWRTREGGSVWDFIPEVLLRHVFDSCNRLMEQAYQKENLNDFVCSFSSALTMWEQGKKWNVFEDHQKFSDHWDLSQFLLKSIILVQKQLK